MNVTELRLKIRHFFRKYRKVIIIGLIIWAIIFLVNQIIMNMPKNYEPETSYDAHTSIMSTSSKTPKSMRQPIENVIKEYVDYLNEGNFQSAFNMLSDDCKRYGFNYDINEYMKHVFTKMPTPKQYAIQNYSNIKYGKKDMYIYEVRYFDDFLATGLTNSKYEYTSEDITFYYGDNGLEMNVGNYIYHTDIKNISENDYLKIDVIDKVVNYSIETYEVKFTNRSDYIVVVADGVEEDEVQLLLPNETRQPSEFTDIILGPDESITAKFTFPKFVDDGDMALSLVFSAVRVMEKYSGTEDVDEAVIQEEINNAISKFSMEVAITE
ncbi:MAG: hypothetical protein IKL55_01090 [Clostridia bacterium]|nr:hypothetical protein [Clostridia bacterium]